MTGEGLKRYIPILSWLPTYNRDWLPKDTMAGLTVWGVIIPTSLAYANALTVRDRLVQMLSEADEPLKVVLFDAAVQSGLDITSSDMLKKLIKQLHNQGLVTYFAEVQEPVLEFSARTGLLDVIGKDNVFSTVEEAVNYIETL
jgi:MFS superfamily sulfate permease-like transporter